MLYDTTVYATRFATSTMRKDIRVTRAASMTHSGRRGVIVVVRETGCVGGVFVRPLLCGGRSGRCDVRLVSAGVMESLAVGGCVGLSTTDDGTIDDGTIDDGTIDGGVATTSSAWISSLSTTGAG